MKNYFDIFLGHVVAKQHKFREHSKNISKNNAKFHKKLYLTLFNKAIAILPLSEMGAVYQEASYCLIRISM